MDELELEYLDSGLFDSPKSLVALWERFVAGAGARKKVTVKLFGAARDGIGAQEAEEKYGSGVTLRASREQRRRKVVVARPGSGVLGSCLAGEVVWPRRYICSRGPAWA